jgi:hypothetical protein
VTSEMRLAGAIILSDSDEAAGAPVLEYTRSYDLPEANQIVTIHCPDGSMRNLRFTPVQVRAQELSGPPPLDMGHRAGK